MVVRALSLIAVLGVAGAYAASALLDVNDSKLVGSEVKEQIRPFEDLHEAGTESKHDYGGDAGKEFAEDDDEKGYYKSKSSKGNKGYKHFDSWHKKGGDKYGFEKHSSHGMKKGDENGGGHYTSGGKKADFQSAGSEKHSEKLQKAPKDVNAEGTGYSYSHYESEGDDDAGHYTDGGDSGHYEAEHDGDHEGYEGGDHEGYDGGEYHGDSGAYSEGGNEGESGSYTEGEADEGDHAGYTAGETGDHAGDAVDHAGDAVDHAGDTVDHAGDVAGDHAGYTAGSSIQPGGATSYYIRHY